MTPETALQTMRAESPLVHCITNYVAMNIAASVTLAAGGSPAMIHAPEEVADFIPIASALTINIGTLSSPWFDSMLIAAKTAHSHSVPWVLDPVAHFVTPYRGKATQNLLAQRPTVVRGNASEIIAMMGKVSGGKGADSGDSVTEARSDAIDLATQNGCVVAVTGPADFVTDGTRHVTVHGGAEVMPKVTALGCSLTALIGAYVAVVPAMEATVAALLHFALAGEQAAKTSSGPGSFSVQFVDQLYAIQPNDLDEDRLTWS